MTNYLITDNGNIVANINGAEIFISNDGKQNNLVENPCFDRLKNNLKVYKTRATTPKGVYKFHKNLISKEAAEEQKHIDEFNSSKEVGRYDLGTTKIQLRSNGRLYEYNFGWSRRPLTEAAKTAIRARIEHKLPLFFEKGKNKKYDALVAEVISENELKLIAERSLEEEVEALKIDGVIPAIVDNIAVVLRWLNTENWSSWDLPALSIGYNAYQFDCDGKIATGIILDKKIEGEYKYCVGAPRGYLSSYQKLR